MSRYMTDMKFLAKLLSKGENSIVEVSVDDEYNVSFVVDMSSDQNAAAAVASDQRFEFILKTTPCAESIGFEIVIDGSHFIVRKDGVAVNVEDGMCLDGKRIRGCFNYLKNSSHPFSRIVLEYLLHVMRKCNTSYLLYIGTVNARNKSSSEETSENPDLDIAEAGDFDESAFLSDEDKLMRVFKSCLVKFEIASIWKSATFPEWLKSDIQNDGVIDGSDEGSDNGETGNTQLSSFYVAPVSSNAESSLE
jgi:hypothetical protein